MGKAAKSVSIIGGSDGPTSIFLVGNKHEEKNLINRFKHIIRVKRHQQRLEKVRKSIQPGTHTLDETISYMRERYGMAEVEKTSPHYEEYMGRMRFSLVQREKSDLLPERPELKDSRDREAVLKWHNELEEWEKKSEAIVEKLPQEVLNMDYHLFVLDKGEDGSMQVELEIQRELIQIQYDGKGFGSILKDIYSYYGVSREDILNQSERYQNLVAVLAR